MKLSQKLKLARGNCGDIREAIQGYAEEAERLESALLDARAGLRYVRETVGDVYGVGFDRVEKKASIALGDQGVDNDGA